MQVKSLQASRETSVMEKVSSPFNSHIQLGLWEVCPSENSEVYDRWASAA